MTSANSANTAPAVEGLVASRPFVWTWLKRPGRMISYYRPGDCRPSALRISVQLWDDGKGGTARVVEGDGRKLRFKAHAAVPLPDHPDASQVAAAVRGLADEHLDLPPLDEAYEERALAGVLTRAGFILDDFMGTTAWLRPTNREGFIAFVRGEQDPAFFEDDGEQVAVPRSGALESVDLPCEAGIQHEDDLGISTVVCPSVDDAVRLLDEDLVPFPCGIDEHEVHAFETVTGQAHRRR